MLVLINGRPLSIRWAAEHVPAIVEAWLPGEQGGRAVADVLFGDYNPSGRLPVTVPRHVGQLPMYYNYSPAKADTMKRGYVDMSPLPLPEFGYGLSYTNFEYSDLRIEPSEVQSPGQVRISLQLKNTGARAGEEVVQLYLQDLVSSVYRLVKESRPLTARLRREARPLRFELGAEDLLLTGNGAGGRGGDVCSDGVRLICEPSIRREDRGKALDFSWNQQKGIPGRSTRRCETAEGRNVYAIPFVSCISPTFWLCCFVQALICTASRPARVYR